MIEINPWTEDTIEDKRIFKIIRQVCEAKDNQRIRELKNMLDAVGVKIEGKHEQKHE